MALLLLFFASSRIVAAQPLLQAGLSKFQPKDIHDARGNQPLNIERAMGEETSSQLGLGLQETQGGDISIDEPDICTEVQSDEQAIAFKNFLRRQKLAGGGGVPFACAQLDKLGAFLTELWIPEIHPVTLVNIGANKGYNLVEWIDWWSSKAGKGTSEWRAHLVQTFGIDNFTNWHLCGGCSACKQQTKLPGSKLSGRDTAQLPPGLEIHAIEASRSNFGLLKDLQRWAGQSGLQVVHTALSNFVGVALFPVTKLGDEASALSSKSLNVENVTVLTVDQYMDLQGMDRINYLVMDTEGHDPLVLQGAKKALSDNRIDLLQFEFKSIRRLSPNAGTAAYLESRALKARPHVLLENGLQGALHPFQVLPTLSQLEHLTT